MADHITNLVEIYDRWLSKEENKNVDKGSADDVLYDNLFTNSLTDYQKKWIERFVYTWELAQEHEQTLPHVVEQIKEEKQRAKEDALYDIKREYEK